jgi:hypothetical protein
MNVSSPWAGLGQRAGSSTPEQAPSYYRGRVSRTECMRQALRTRGPLPASELVTHAELKETALVGALLKNDIRKGLVSFDGEFYAIK